MSSGSSPQHQAALNVLAGLNELTIKAFSCKNKDALIFLMLNDTIKLVRYDRAMLFKLEGKTPSLLGVSGHASFSRETDFVKKLQIVTTKIKEPGKIQILTEESFDDEGALFSKVMEKGPGGTVLWVPIIVDGKLTLGVLLERWHQLSWHSEEISIISFLSRGYSAAWLKFKSVWEVSEPTKMAYKIFAVTIAILICFIPTPLRIVAPCEVVAKDPYLVTAPLNGIVEEVLVLPGEEVTKNQLLFKYDKRVPLQELKVAEKQVDIAKSQLNRIMTQGYNDPDALSEASIWQLQLDRDQIKLDLAKYYASRLEVKAPIGGVVSFDDPDDWRGRPVQIGEKVMVIVDPHRTKVKILISESDNIAFLGDEPVKIFLNIDPATTYTADVVYVADYSLLSATGITSFAAEAFWIDGPKDVKIGLKGTAVLYGEYVPLIYWLLRKPWTTFRQFIGF